MPFEMFLLGNQESSRHFRLFVVACCCTVTPNHHSTTGTSDQSCLESNDGKSGKRPMGLMEI